MHKLGHVILTMTLLLPALPSLAGVDDEIKAAEERLRYLQEKRAQKAPVAPLPPAKQKSEREIQLERELQQEREQRLERELREIRQHQQRQAKSSSTWTGVAIGCGIALVLLLLLGASAG